MDSGLIIVLTIIFLPLVLLVISSVRAKKARQRFEVELSEAKDRTEQVQKDLRNLQSDKNALLDKYSPIINMELHTQQLLDTAEEDAAATRHEAEGVFSEAEALRKETRQKLSEAKEKAEGIKNDAREEATKVVSFAEAQAKEIAGDAYEAKAKADSYEKAIRAMRNTIDGYKDDYIIPNQSVLDDLAEEFSYKEAGEELKAARKRVKTMVKEGHAGACDYVEAHRKTYAIHFAVDAFNGKVDSALSKTKHDNFGKIQQEIIDSFALVNHNGAPFRNARINQEYLDARLTELKWAVAAFELRKIEKEEQAEIKAQIREEERAIREMEKARKEAEKEEKMLQKALEKARAELGQASEEQKAEFEAQLAELEGKLQEAEEKGQRALSMAQQTRRGHVYVISNVGSFGEEVFKIGMTRRLEPMDRVKELGDASVPFSFDVHAMIYSDDAPTLEKELHRKFNEQSVNKINPRKEFFRTTIAEVKQAVEQQGLDEVHWTLKAEAAEFRESLAIEKEQQAEAVA
ncbi:Phage protein [Vibrio coralliirubri]|uniref:DUF4041 domain-containing protein n=1 Tax=Vibrio coralliirubri TaxID=1516159 RepID=UPI0006330DE5|nr:DUF4041 domain-containing protein [Vibrio coralliirubri]CDT98727.1 Phage protein [Vibrio coralliirubri]